MKVEDNLCPVTDEDAWPYVFQTLSFQIIQLLKECWDVAHHPSSDEVYTIGVDETGGKEMEIVGNPVGDDCMSSVVPSLGSSAELYCRAQNIDQLSFALIAPLRTQHNCCHIRIFGVLIVCDDEMTVRGGGNYRMQASDRGVPM